MRSPHPAFPLMVTDDMLDASQSETHSLPYKRRRVPERPVIIGAEWLELGRPSVSLLARIMPDREDGSHLPRDTSTNDDSQPVMRLGAQYCALGNPAGDAAGLPSLPWKGHKHLLKPLYPAGRGLG